MRRVLLLSLLAAACRERHDSSLAVARIDTVGGHISVTSSGPTGWADSAHAWRLVPAGTFGGATGTPGELIDPQGIAVDEAGRVYVADDKPSIIKVYGADGHFLHTIGGEGEGPGEFKVAFIATGGGHLVVHDPSLARTSVFDTSGKYLRSWKSACCYYDAIGVDSSNRIYVPTNTTAEQKRAANYLRYDISGTLLDTVTVPRGAEVKSWVIRQGTGANNRMMMSTSVPAAPRMFPALDPAGGVVYGHSSEYRLVESSNGRDTVQMFGRSWTPAPLSAARRHAMVEERVASVGKRLDPILVRQSFVESDVPGTLPAFEMISIDGAGNRWIRQDNGGDTTRTHYDVFDRKGSYLGPVTLARKIPMYGAVTWGRDDLYAGLESAEGSPVIERFHIQRKGGK